MYNHKKAIYYRKQGKQACVCTLCPKECSIAEGKNGACGTRENINGDLYIKTYGKSLALTQEVIEAEAVYERDPGAQILSIGNIGCNMHCDFCQNWTTSQIKNIKKENVVSVTKEEIIKEALRRNINILSWTYNDPVVWHEFLYDVAKEAKMYGLRNLYKSAFFINEEPVKDLLEVIDIFSISLKSMSEEFYNKHCKTSLKPVLKRIKQVYNSNAYLELSNLIITGRNDKLEEVKRLVDWVLTNLDSSIPLHFVAFHPAYKYTSVQRTPKTFLKEAKETANAMGMKYVSIGNVFDRELSLKQCISCNAEVIERTGLHSEYKNIKISNDKFICSACNKELPIILDTLDSVETLNHISIDESKFRKTIFNWDNDAVSVHIKGINNTMKRLRVFVKHDKSNNYRMIEFFPKQDWRFLVARKHKKEANITIFSDEELDISIMKLLDRAHYPIEQVHSEIMETEEA